MSKPPPRTRRLAFLGTPDVAVPPLRALVDAGFDIPLVVTRPDKRRRRRGEPEPSPVKAAALDLGIRVSDQVDDVLDVDVPLAAVVAFGRLIKPHVLEHVPMVNLHFSLLPRWRGAAPVERAILAGDERTGACLMEVVDELDAGDVYACGEMAIGPDDTADELRARLTEVGTDLLVRTLEEGLPEARPQQGEVTYAEKITPDDLHLDWSRPAAELHRVIRVGGAWTIFRGARLKVWRADLGDGGPAPGRLDGLSVGTGDGRLDLVEVQPEGHRRMDATAWANGARPDAGEGLG